MSKVNILYIEKVDFSESALSVYAEFIKSLFVSLNYSNVNIVTYNEMPDKEKIDRIIDDREIDVVFCDLSLGTKMDENALGLENIKFLKLNYPEITVCGISGARVDYRMTARRNNVPTFDLFVDKNAHNYDYYKEHIKNELMRVFTSNVGIEVIPGESLSDRDRKFIEKPFFKRLLKKITFTLHGTRRTSVKTITLTPTTGGFSSSRVFKMICQTESGDTVISSVLKCSERDKAENEVSNYINYVKWYLPYTWRPEMLSYAYGKDYGMICYSFIHGNAGNESSFPALTDRIVGNEFDKVDKAIENIFDGSAQQWYGVNNQKIVPESINKFYQDLYFPVQNHPRDLVEELITSSTVGGRVKDNRYKIETEAGTRDFPHVDSLSSGIVTSSYLQCICHGDLTTNNILISDNDAGLTFIDFQTTGRGHVFHDFIVFEMCLRQHYNPNREISFQSLLEYEIMISDDDYSFAEDNSMWRRIKRVRELAEENFDENFDTYYLGIAMRAFRLFRLFNQNKNLKLDSWLGKVFLSVLLANLLKLEKLSNQGATDDAKAKKAAKTKVTNGDAHKEGRKRLSKGLTIGVTCANDAELKAILGTLENQFKVTHKHFFDNDENDRLVYIFEIVRNNLKNRIFITQQMRQGNTSAAFAYNSLARYKPDFVIFVGVAGALNDRVKIGDVLIPQNVIDSEFKKDQSDNNYKIRDIVYRVCADHIRFVEHFTASCNYEGFSVLSEDILSDNAVIATDDSDLLEKVFSHNDKYAGIEMESAGIYCADYESNDTKRCVFTIRGISDNAANIRDEASQLLAIKNAALVLGDFVNSLLEKNEKK